MMFSTQTHLTKTYYFICMEIIKKNEFLVRNNKHFRNYIKIVMCLSSVNHCNINILAYR